ncbi:MAG: hypothetical protein ACTTKB_05440 [Treponema sp.]
MSKSEDCQISTFVLDKRTYNTQICINKLAMYFQPRHFAAENKHSLKIDG